MRKTIQKKELEMVVIIPTKDSSRSIPRKNIVNLSGELLTVNASEVAMIT